MALNNFIPQVWSARLLRALQKSLVYGQAGIVNRDYEGEIQDAGDTVKINSIGDPTITDYVKNTELPAPEVLSDNQRQLTITQAKAFNFLVDDIDAVQQKPKVMDEAMARAGYRLKDAMDQFIAAKMVEKATFTIGSSGSPISIDNKTNYAYNQLVKAKVLLDENNVPTEDRFVIVPAWFEGALGLDERFVGTRGYDAPNQILLTGEIGQAAGFTVLKSNNVPYVLKGKETEKYKIVAGVAGGTTLAEQIVKTEGYRVEKAFADAVKGLHVYGAEVIRGYELACITVNDGLGLSGEGPQDPPA